MIPTYSLFTGNSDWNHEDHWSHLPTYRHRNALINGNISINTNISCKDIFIGNGNIHILPTGNLSANNLTIYPNDGTLASSSTLRSSGTINISGKITIERTFAQKGKWYFISFPFDVYPPGIDLHFEQKDATPNDGGNYFYVQSYNGDKRASSNQSAGNWEVVPIRPDNVPLFEKNKGYLIALDEKTTNRTLSFSSRPGDIPENFANIGVIAIPPSSNVTPGNQENYGWYLCGNPFPSPLVLSQIEENTVLDGNIYVYNGSGYKTYSLNSNYALPPFTAFFVKASSPTELRVPSNSPSTKAINIIPTNFPMSKSITEPHPDKQSTEIELPNTENFRFFIKDGQLHLQNIPEAGYIKVFNMMGHCMFQKRIRQGSLVVPFTNLSGMYILQIHSANYQKRYKVVLP